MTDTVSMGKLVLFDLDNTLLDRATAFESWAHKFIKDHRLTPDAWPIIELLDNDGFKPRESFFGEIRSRFGITTEAERLVSRFHADFPAYCSIEAETLDAIRRLRAVGWKVGVVTNGSPFQRAKIEAIGMTTEVDAVCISSVVGVKKPEVGIFEEAARACAVPLKGWMVGDSPDADIAGGIRAGLQTIWITRGRVWERQDFCPDAVAGSVAKAVDIILRSAGVGTRSLGGPTHCR